MAFIEWFQSIDLKRVADYAAVASALFAAYAAFNSRRLVVALVHAQRLSVRPIGEFTLDDYEDYIAVILENRGTGPMVVDQFCVMRDGKLVVKNSLIYAEGLPFNETHVVKFVAEIGGSVLLPGKSILLLRAEGTPTDEAFARYRTSLREYLSKLTFHVTYHDIYGTRQQPTVRSGNWFGRHNQSSPSSP